MSGTFEEWPVEITDLLGKLTARRDLTRLEARGLFERIMDGAVGPVPLAAVLAALRTKGETLDEIVGVAESMRARATPVRVPPGVTAIDTCSTGGDGLPTFNISTAVAIVSAAAGATVAKHGNRSNRRPSGSAEGLAALGINVEAEVSALERSLRECRVAFLYAARLHPAMRHAAPTRAELKFHTIFNLVGPLTNPAGVRRQLLGVSRPELVETMVAALRLLGAERAMVVHGLDGLCDLSVSGPSRVARWDGLELRMEEVDGGVVGVGAARLEALFVRSPAESARVVADVLAGSPGPARDVVVFNAAAALWVAGLADDWAAGAQRAREALDSGAAGRLLRRWRAVTRESGSAG